VRQPTGPHDARLGVRVQYGGVDDAAVQAAQHAQIVLQGVPHQQSLRADQAKEPLLQKCMSLPSRWLPVMRRVSHSDSYACAKTYTRAGRHWSSTAAVQHGEACAPLVRDRCFPARKCMVSATHVTRLLSTAGR